MSAVFAAARIVVLLGLVRAAGDVLSAAMLGAFLLSRRIASTGSNLFQFGASQTLRRYISMHADERHVKFTYFALALGGWTVLSVVGIPVAYVFRAGLGSWLFPGTADAAALAFWTAVQVHALILGFIVFSSLIAERKIAIGNALDTMAAGGFLLPLLLLQSSATSPMELIRFHSLAVIGSSFLIAVWYMHSLRPNGLPNRTMLNSALRDFRGYGLPRTMVTFLDMGILLIGPWLLRSSPEEAGYLIIALTLTRAVQAAILPLTQIASVITARLTGTQNEAALDDGVKMLFGTLVYSSTLVAAILVPWREPVLQLWLGNAGLVEGVRFYFDALMWAIIPFAVFQGLKGIIEMRWFRARNLYSLVASIAVYFAAYFFFVQVWGIREAARLSTLLAFVVLGVCTVLWCRSYLRPFVYWGLFQLAIATGVLVAINAVAASQGGFGAFLIAMSISLVVLGALVVIRPAPYIQALHSFVLPGRRVPGMSS